MKKSIINFNHVSKNIAVEDMEKYISLYKFYHKLSICFKWKYKRLRRTILLLNMTGIGLTCVGVVSGGVTLNPVVLGTLTGMGLLVKGYITKSNAIRNVEKCKYAHTNYKKILTQLRTALRGASLDSDAFLTELKIIDDIVTDTCPDIDGFTKRYDRTFTVDV